jgi:hypothetical protein
VTCVCTDDGVENVSETCTLQCDCCCSYLSSVTVCVLRCRRMRACVCVSESVRDYCICVRICISAYVSDCVCGVSLIRAPFFEACEEMKHHQSIHSISAEISRLRLRFEEFRSFEVECHQEKGFPTHDSQFHFTFCLVSCSCKSSVCVLLCLPSTVHAVSCAM